MIVWVLRAVAPDLDTLGKARSLYDEAEFAKAIVLLESALAADAIAEQDEMQAHVLLGSSFVALRKDDEAKRAFRWVAGNDPAFRLADLHRAAKCIRNLFDEVRAHRPVIRIGSVTFPNALQAELQTHRGK